MKKIHLFFLIAIVAIAIIPRFYNIIDQGFVSWDEGMYMNEALFYESIIHNMPLIFSQLLTRSLTAHTVEELIEGWPPSSAKPAHSFFIYLFTIFVGMHISASKILAASFGVLTVIMLFIFIRSWYGNVIGMIAALFLAVSGYHIYVSRLGVPETDSMFFFILGWYLFGESIKNKKIFKYKYIILCGLTLGLSFTLCYRWIVAIPIIWLCELIRFFQNKQNGKITLLKRMSILSASFLFFPLLCDIPYWPIRLFTDFSVSFQHIPQNIYGYFDQLVFYLLLQSHHGSFHPHTLYITFLTRLNGIPITVLSLIGIFILIKRHSLRDILIVFPPLILFTLLSLKTRGNSLRYISLALPFLSTLAAIACVYIAKCISTKPKVFYSILVPTVIVLSFSSIAKIFNILTLTSGYEESKVYLEQNRGEQNLSTSNSYFEFYFGRNISEQIPPTLDAIGYLLKEGNFKFIILDFMSHRVLKKEAKVFIEEQCKPVARFKNEIGTNAFTLIESLGYRHDAKDYIRKALSDPHSQYIEIYKASDVLEALSRRNHGIISDNA